MQNARCVRAIAAGKGRAAAGLSQCMTSDQAYALLDAEDSARASESRALPPPPVRPHARQSSETKRDHARPSEITRPSELPMSPPAAPLNDALPSSPTSSSSSIAAAAAMPTSPAPASAREELGLLAADDADDADDVDDVDGADGASAREEFGRLAEAVTAEIEDLALIKGSSSSGIQ